jgi:hypothetical protein
MNEAERDRYLCLIRDKHILIESALQQIGYRVSQAECSSCAKVCCEEAICRETTGSDFLRYLSGVKISEYDRVAGWYKKDRGCSLTYGRPLVCYEFFCSGFGNTHGPVELQHLAGQFRQCYARVLGNRHILAVDDIRKISLHKLAKVLVNLERLEIAANEALLAVQ